MSPNQRRALVALASAETGYCLYFDTIAERAGMTRREARIATRALSRMGLARLEQLFDEGTGLTSGSGYGITREGIALVEANGWDDEDLALPVLEEAEKA